MKKRVILAVDQGTTNSKAILVDTDGGILARGSSSVPIEHPKSGWVQQDPAEIWQSVVTAIQGCLGNDREIWIEAIGISNQRESVTAWRRSTGEPLGPCITWQCRRTAADCEKLRNDGVEPMVVSRTGIPLDPLFPAPKIKWLAEHAKYVDPSDICVGTVDSWLLWNFTRGNVHACDCSNAARTQLYNIRDGAWDSELCDLFGVPMECLPTPMDSNSRFGTTQDVPGLPDGIPIAGAIGDSHGALFGHCAFEPGDGKVTFGTGSSVMAMLPEFILPEHGITTTIAWSMNGTPTYAFEGNILVSASALPWAADLLGLDGNVEALMSLAYSVENSGGVYFVPALVGLGSPHWNSSARGLFSGLSFNSGRAQTARAVAESVALQVHDVCIAMRAQSPNTLGRIFVDGGPSKNRFLMELVSGLLGNPVVQSESSESSALGAAFLAGLTCGVWRDVRELAALPKKTKFLTPTMTTEDRDRLLAGWNDALARATLPIRPEMADNL